MLHMVNRRYISWTEADRCGLVPKGAGGGRATRDRRCRLAPVLMVLMGLAVVGSGCQHQKLADKRIAVRQGSMRCTLGVAQESLESRPERLRLMCHHIDDVWCRDVDRFGELDEEAALYWDSRLKSWERNSRILDHELADVMVGRPENIEPTAIYLFY